MANTFAPFGLSQTGGAPGAAPNAEQLEYPILYSDSNKIFSGDPVQMGSNGYIKAWTTTPSPVGVSQLFGVFTGCKYLSVSQSKVVWSPYWPGSDAVSGSVYGYVVPCSPGTAPRFLVQTGNNNSLPATQTNVGYNYDVNMGTGSTITGRSGAYLDLNGGTPTTTSTLPFRIISLYNGVGNGSDLTSQYNWVIVEANTLQTTGV